MAGSEGFLWEVVLKDIDKVESTSNVNQTRWDDEQAYIVNVQFMTVSSTAYHPVLIRLIPSFDLVISLDMSL